MDRHQPEKNLTWSPTGPGDFAISYYVGPRSPTSWFTGLDRYPTMEAAEIQAVNMIRREVRSELTPIVRRAVAVS